MKRFLSVLLTMAMLLSMAAAPASAMTQEEMLERVRQAMATPTPQPTAPPAPEEEPAESQEEAPAADDAAAEETAQAPAAANEYEGLYRTTGYTPVYTDAAMKKGVGLIQGKSVVLVLEKAGYAYKIFFAYGKTGAEGYVDESTVIRLSEAEAAAYLSQTDGTAVSKKGYKLMPVAFTAMGKGPQQVTPEPEAEPTPAPAAQPAAEEAPAEAPAAEQPAQEPEGETPDAPEAPGEDTEDEAASEEADGEPAQEPGEEPEPETVLLAGPAITQQPQLQIIDKYGDSVSFSVTAADATGYAWQYSSDLGGTWNDLTNGNVWKGNKTSKLTFVTKESWKLWLFRCAVTNAEGTTYSSGAGFKLSDGAVAITKNPADVTVAAGGKATFSVTASNATAYQWQYRTSGTGTWADLTNGNVWKGKDTATLTFTAKESWNGWQFRCAASGGDKTAYSSAATLTVTASTAAPVFTVQPKAASVTAGGKATFTVTATGAKTYQWQYRASSSGTWTNLTNGNVWKGKDTATLTFTAKESWNGWEFRCAAANDSGTAYSNAAKLTVAGGAAAVITKQPADQTVAAGKTATFSVTATGAKTYQWEYSKDNGAAWTALTNGNVWKGKDTATLTFTVKNTWYGWLFRCVVTGADGTKVNSDPAELKQPAAALSITAQPEDQTVVAGKTATFSVTATGADTYQWQYRATSSGTWTALTNGNVWKGKDTATLTFTTKESWNGWEFRCVVSNAGGSLNSDGAKLTVTAASVFIFGKDSDGNTAVIGYNGTDAAVVIPETDDQGNAIKAIGPEAFKGNTAITSVTMPNTVTVIRDSAFENCSGLTTVTFSTGLKRICKAAFKNCKALKRGK